MPDFVAGKLDFRGERPQRCAICTSLTDSAIDAKWVHALLCLAVGTILELKQRTEIEETLEKWKSAGFRFHVVTGVSDDDLMSGDVDENAALAAFTGLTTANSRSDACLMPDPFGRTGMVRFCFFFKKSDRGGKEASGSRASKTKKSWWQFW